ncbi:hypothetical protein CkaCkLH20_11258 [Colletotrichum karsti]|uniref:Uncharacterized protein n=1 Tax=Colletotrichum karsti TaxID=1095194 RepID=A0A9P6LGD9_9PEZI|nr:uncharacterized protein CkaCkLH20_11258 [Colletotrichum karsti]KAF9871337.1 hypothetical protein CkaCkLH20_11258 [Colletotrichum karsti]
MRHKINKNNKKAKQILQELKFTPSKIDFERFPEQYMTETWAFDDTRPTPASCSVAGYSFTVRFPSNTSSIESWSALIGIEGRPTWFRAVLDTSSPDYTCAHSGEAGVLSTCLTTPSLQISAAPVSPVLPPEPAYPEIEITNVSAETLSNNNLVFEFDVVDNTNNKTAHCSNQWISGARSVIDNACSVAGYTSDIDFPNGFNIQSWTVYIDVEGKPTAFKADVKTGTPDYTCGHSGTGGVLSACFTGAGVKIAAARWSIWGPSS